MLPFFCKLVSDHEFQIVLIAEPELKNESARTISSDKFSSDKIRIFRCLEYEDDIGFLRVQKHFCKSDTLAMLCVTDFRNEGHTLLRTYGAGFPVS